MPTPPSRSPRVLVGLPGWVGDCALATPALRALRRALPEAWVGALVHANLAPLFDPCPWLDELVLLPGRRRGVPDAWPGGLAETARVVAARRFDVALLLRGSFRSALEVRLAGIPRRIGFADDLRSPLLTGIVPRPRGLSTAAEYLRLARALGGGSDEGNESGEIRLELQTHPGDDARAAELLATAGASAGAGVLLLSPGAGPRPSKIWPAERFAELARRCHDELALAIVVNGSPDDAPRIARVVNEAGVPALDLGRHGVDTRLLKSIVRAARVVVGNDSGPRHLAAALGTPAVTIFGPTDPRWTVNGSRLEQQIRVDTWCSPCEWRRCPIGHGCMRRVEVDAVFTAVERAIAGKTGDSSPVPECVSPEARLRMRPGFRSP